MRVNIKPRYSEEEFRRFQDDLRRSQEKYDEDSSSSSPKHELPDLFGMPKEILDELSRLLVPFVEHKRV